jgi:phage shock protein PspC (stress-responsive transcriptional regulator)
MAVMERSQLVRSRSDRRIAGVCAGLARYFGIDPVLVRIAFVVTAFMGFGILAYIVLWIALPEGDPAEASSGAWFGRSSPAVRIAEERYARGEISAEDLNRIREDLIGTP